MFVQQVFRLEGIGEVLGIEAPALVLDGERQQTGILLPPSAQRHTAFALMRAAMQNGVVGRFGAGDNQTTGTILVETRALRDLIQEGLHLVDGGWIGYYA